MYAFKYIYVYEVHFLAKLKTQKLTARQNQSSRGVL